MAARGVLYVRDLDQLPAPVTTTTCDRDLRRDDPGHSQDLLQVSRSLRALPNSVQPHVFHSLQRPGRYTHAGALIFDFLYFFLY